jgi:hypothetical protein
MTDDLNAEAERHVREQWGADALPIRDEQGRFVASTDLADALRQGGYPALDEARQQLQRSNAANLERIGIRQPQATPAASTKPKAPPDWGGGVRGRTPDAATPSMNDALKALARHNRGY